MSEPTIRRAKHGKDNPYFPMRRDTAQDHGISAESLGILTEVLSRPDDWQIQVGQLQQRKDTGRDKVYRILKELIEARYVERIITRNAKGQVTSVEYVVYEEPLPEKPETAEPETVEPDTAKPDTAFQDYTENRPLPKTEGNEQDSAPSGAASSKTPSKKAEKPKKAAAPKAPADPAKAARDTGIVAIIEAWLKKSGVLAKNPYGNTGNRDYAGALHDAGVTPADVTDYIDHIKRFDKFWADKAPGLKYVAQNYKGWRARHPEYHAAGTVPAAPPKPSQPAPTQTPSPSGAVVQGVPDKIKKILEEDRNRYGNRRP